MRNGTAERRQDLYREAVELIERDYGHDLQIEGVARSLATSRRQLQRAFSEAGGTSFRDVLADVRMRHARRLLREGMIPVRTIAASVGYHQPAQFAKTFRRHHGTAPSDYRRDGTIGNGRIVVEQPEMAASEATNGMLRNEVVEAADRRFASAA